MHCQLLCQPYIHTQLSFNHRLLCLIYCTSHVCLARSDHFQEFFQAAKGTATALNDCRSTDASEPADAAQPSSPTAAVPKPTTPSTSAVQSADSTPPAQDADSLQAQVSLVEDDPQTLRQQQHEQAADNGQSDLQVRFADVGCGFGGLLVRLSPLYPDKLMVGMEIRDKVCFNLARACLMVRACLRALWTLLLLLHFSDCSACGHVKERRSC